jgi:hypothetical protein
MHAVARLGIRLGSGVWNASEELVIQPDRGSKEIATGNRQVDSYGRLQLQTRLAVMLIWE